MIWLLTLSIANAGWWSNFCERHLIADDPYQFEQTGGDWHDDWMREEDLKTRARALLARKGQT